MEVHSLDRHGAAAGGGGYAPVNTREWIERWNPRFVLLSVAAGDELGRPDEETLEVMEGYPLLRTDLNGWIEIIIDGERLWVGLRGSREGQGKKPENHIQAGFNPWFDMTLSPPMGLFNPGLLGYRLPAPLAATIGFGLTWRATVGNTQSGHTPKPDNLGSNWKRALSVMLFLSPSVIQSSPDEPEIRLVLGAVVQPDVELAAGANPGRVGLPHIGIGIRRGIEGETA
jgi:hypothetical protein